MLNAIHPSPMAVNVSAVDVNKVFTAIYFISCEYTYR